MENIIKVKEKIGKQVTVRYNLRQLKPHLSDNTVLDFAGVMFISRSVADELYNLKESYRGIRYENMDEHVGSMFKTVGLSRSKKREFRDIPMTVHYCPTFDDLKRALLK